MSTSLLRFISSLIVVNCQSHICVWNSIDDLDHLNGIYEIQRGLHNGESYWKQTPTPSPSKSCPITPNYIFAVIGYDPEGERNYWFIHESLQNDYIFEYPDCDDPFSSNTFPTSPTQCIDGWYIWPEDDANLRQLLPLTVTDGLCPSLSCDYISVSNTGYTQCDETFAADAINTNVFISNNIYFFFNQYSFQWHCSDNADSWSDCDDTITAIVSQTTDNWDHVNSGESFTIEMDNNNAATVECVDAITTTTQSIITITSTVDPSTLTIATDAISTATATDDVTTATDSITQAAIDTITTTVTGIDTTSVAVTETITTEGIDTRVTATEATMTAKDEDSAADIPREYIIVIYVLIACIVCLIAIIVSVVVYFRRLSGKHAIIIDMNNAVIDVAINDGDKTCDIQQNNTIVNHVTMTPPSMQKTIQQGEHEYSEGLYIDEGITKQASNHEDDMDIDAITFVSAAMNDDIIEDEDDNVTSGGITLK